MVWTYENSTPSSCSRRRRSSMLPTTNSRRNSRDRSHLRRQSYNSTTGVVTASITALLLLVPSSTTTTTTFSQAFRSSFPRRGAASVSTSASSTIFHPSQSSSRTASTCCFLFRQDDPNFHRGIWNRRKNIQRGSNYHYYHHYFSSNNSQKTLGSVHTPLLHRRDMTTTTTSLSSTNSPFFFTTPSTTDGVEHEYGQEVYTMESLCSYAQKLITKNSSSPQQHHQFCVFLAGGGSMAVSTLAATPGASSFLLEGRTTYDRHSYLNACEMPDRDTKGKRFSYGGEEAAGLAADAALKQALKVTSMDDDLRRMPLTIGVGCASVLVSGEGSPRGKGTVVAKAADGLVLTLNIEMKEEGRSRFEEDLVLSHLVLRSAEQIMLYRDEESTHAPTVPTDNTFMTQAGDIITERWELPTSTSTPSLSPNGDADAADAVSATIVSEDIDAVVEEAAKRVVDGGEDAVVLLPLYEDKASRAPTKIRSLSQTVLPNRSLVFPGSFNPIHVGHLALANAAIRTLEKHEPYVHPRRHNDKPIFFELSLTNVDKPSIDPKIVAYRVKKFIELASDTATGDEPFPQQWGIVLTRAPLFEEKLKILNTKVLNRLEGPEDSPRINFVIGTDTMVRILNPKYYRDQSPASMIESLLELKASGVGFIVGGRLEQQSSSSSSLAPRFVSGQEELVGLPDEVASMFTIMEESEFRVDLSSSEIRKEQERREKESLTS